MARGSFRIALRDDRITPHLDRLSALDAEDIVTATADELARAAKAATPRDTGGLVNSVRVEVDGMRGRVGYTAEHAPHVEYGHRQNVGQFVPALGKRLKAPYVPGQHFFRPCVERARSNFRRRVREALEEAAS